MATAQALPRAATAGGEEIKFEYGVPQVFALKFLSAKEVQGKYGARALFTASDDRRIWLDTEDASDIERTIRALGVQPGDPIRVMKVKHPKGGGHSMRVERFGDAAEPLETAEDRNRVALLEKSLEMARAGKRLNGAAAQAAPGPTITEVPSQVQHTNDSAPAAGQPAKGTYARMLAGALIAAIDGFEAARSYAKSKGIDIEFTGEDIRCGAISMLIQTNWGAR